MSRERISGLAVVLLFAFWGCTDSANTEPDGEAPRDGEPGDVGLFDSSVPGDATSDASSSPSDGGGDASADAASTDATMDGSLSPSDGGGDTVEDASVEDAGTCDPAACNDCNECTDDQCDVTAGCSNPVLPDGTPCSIGECEAGTCVNPAELATLRVFRMHEMLLVDPHFVYSTVIYGTLGSINVCRDVTHASMNQRWSVGFTSGDVEVPGLNPGLAELMGQDGTADCHLDLSVMLAFNPFDQADEGDGSVALTYGRCRATDPLTCTPDSEAPANPPVAYVSMESGTCLEPIPGTTGPILQAVEPNTITGPCFVSEPAPLTVVLPYDGEFFFLPLEHAQIGGQWQGDPATGISDGLLRGFLPMAVADQLVVVHLVQGVGGVTTVLGRDAFPDDTGSGAGAHGCGEVARTFAVGGTTGSNRHVFDTDPTSTTCPLSAGDARDLLDEEGGATYDNCGWWVYFNFTGSWVEHVAGF
jgi:hypothetical protein